jgi:hypothetical protein
VRDAAEAERIDLLILTNGLYDRETLILQGEHGMTIQLVRKPPIGNTRSDRLKITLDGRHTMKEKACMLMQVKSWLLHEQGIDTVGPSDFYISLLDPNFYPLTTLRDGRAVADYILVINSPYRSAADEYDRRPPPSGPSPF